MTGSSILAAAALVVAIAALLRARRVARRLEKVVESYWELRYEYGQLRAQLDKLHGRDDPIAAGTTAFVPLSGLRSPERGGAFAEPRAAEGVPAAPIKRP